MNDLHEPSPEFLQHLEWQTRTEVRRQQRFAESPRRSLAGLTRFVRTAALVLLSLSVGASAVLAVERLQDSRDLEVLLERNRIRVELAERRVESAEEQLELCQLRYDEGLVPATRIRESRRRLAEVRTERDHLRLDREELSAARRAPERELTAPLAGPRDFVSEHLRLDRAHAAHAVELASQDLEVVELHVANGLAPSSDLEVARRDFGNIERAIGRIDGRLELRADYLLGRLDRDTCERRDLVLDAEQRRSALAAEAEFLRGELERVLQMEAEGLIGGRSGPMRDELDAVDVELQLLDLELELLR